jgi:hypothetical protein
VNNPAPDVSGISPSSKTVGDAGFTLTVNGTGFVTSTVVKWEGANRTTSFVSSIQVTAEIPASDLTTGGTFDVTASIRLGGGTSAAKTFTVSNPSPTVTSISPTSEDVGGPESVMTVYGTGFVDGSVVRLEGADKVTTFVTSTQLQATINTADRAAAGTYSITVFSSAPGGGISNAATTPSRT